MKKLNIQLEGKGKKLALSVGAGAAALAVIAGVVFGVRGRGEPVGVYPFTMVGMTEFWGDNQESYGPVTTDKIQTVFLSDTQTITGVKVRPGDQVKKGDVLMTYDTTLSELQLERKRLDVEKAKLQVKEAEEQLQKILKMQPMGDVNINYPGGNNDWGDPLEDGYKVISEAPKFDGTKPEKALVCWVKTDTPINNAMLRDLYFKAVDYQSENEKAGNSSASLIPEEGKNEGGETQPSTEETQPETTETKPASEETQPSTEDTQPIEGEETQPTGESGRVPEAAPEENHAAPSSEPEPEQPVIYSPHLLFSGDKLTVTSGRAVNLTFINKAQGNATWSLQLVSGNSTGGELIGKPSGRGFVVYGFPTTVGKMKYTVEAIVDGVPSTKYEFYLDVIDTEENQKEVNGFDVILKRTLEDREKAPVTMWQGVHVTVYNGNDYGITFFDAPSPEIFFPDDSEDDTTFPDIDFGSGMTAAEIAKLRREQEKKIKELAATAQMTESEYKLMEREYNDGNIRATLDGEVVSLLTEEEARENRQPMMKVSGGGGFYVEGSVSELEKDNLKPGQEVTINDWNTGSTYTGEVRSIGDFPVTGNGWNGMGNPNASYYPFRVFIDGSADLQEGSYVSVTYSAAEAENGIYLENPFLRTEDGVTYVYVRDAHNRLEKRVVTTGKSLWGSYTEIRSGLTQDDYIAFPYGKTVKPGANTVESDLSALYGY